MVGINFKEYLSFNTYIKKKKAKEIQKERGNIIKI